MFRIMGRSKSVASFVSAAVLASVLIAPAAIAGPYSAGNSNQIPYSNSRAYFSTEEPTQATPRRTVRQAEPSVVERSTSNPAMSCDHGYRWEETAANGWTLPMPCNNEAR
jgi:hypothetical protein